MLAVDASDSITQSLANKVTHVVSADATDPDVLQSLGVGQFSHAVVAIGDNIEASILCTAALADLGVEQIWAKAITQSHARILTRVGATKVVFPERDMGVRMAHQVTGQLIDYIEIDEHFALVETRPPRDVAGQTLQEAQLRARYGVTVVSIKPDGGTFTYATPETVLAAGSLLLVAGTNEAIERFAATT
ncbi:MAG: TrkA family potassium uptake protein [Acidimicrobiales bacterium]